MPVYRDDDSESLPWTRYDEAIAQSVIVLVSAPGLQDQADGHQNFLEDIHGFHCLNLQMEDDGISGALREIDPDVTVILAESEKSGNEFAQRLLPILPRPLATITAAPEIEGNWFYFDIPQKVICAKMTYPPDLVIFPNTLIRLIRFAHQCLELPS